MTTTTPSTLLGSLTTTYTPIGTECPSIHFASNAHETSGWLARAPIESDYLTSSCMPRGYTRAPQFYYSPGVCPSGFTVACSSAMTLDSVTTTVATCCPTSYGCFQNRDSGNIYGCSSLITSDTVFVGWSVNYETVTTASTTEYPVETSMMTMTITQDEYFVNAYGVIVQRESDDPLFEAQETGTSSSVASSTASSAATESGLSTGAKAGLGVGVSIAALLFLGSVAFFFMARRRGRGAGNHEGPQRFECEEPAHSANSPIAFSEFQQSPGSPPYSELQQHGSRTTQQLAADKAPVELLGDTNQYRQ